MARQLSRLEMDNKLRGCLGLAPLTKKDIPPGEDWETVPPHILLTRKEREERVDEILRIPSDEEEAAGPMANNEDQSGGEPTPPQTT